jgi:hydroxymethylbilane synthase
VDDTTVHLTGLIASIDGRELIRDTLTAPLAEATQLGTRLADELLARGGKAILDAVYNATPDECLHSPAPQTGPDQ